IQLKPDIDYKYHLFGNLLNQNININNISCNLNNNNMNININNNKIEINNNNKEIKTVDSPCSIDEEENQVSVISGMMTANSKILKINNNNNIIIKKKKIKPPQLDAIEKYRSCASNEKFLKQSRDKLHYLYKNTNIPYSKPNEPEYCYINSNMDARHVGMFD